VPTLPAHLVAGPVLEHLTRPADGVVLGAGPTAAWVDLDGFVVAVTTREVPLLPNAVALGTGSGTLARPGLTAGGRARLGPGRVELGTLRITWDPTSPPAWDPRVAATTAAHEAVARRGGALRGALGAVDNPAHPGPRSATLPLRGASQPEVGVGGALDPEPVRLVRELGMVGLATAADPGGAGALTRLLAAVRERDPGRAAGAARALLGRGPGLTPEGDDLLAAVAGTLAVLGPAAGWDPSGLAGFLAALVEPARARTTALSATLLELAAQGRLAEPAGRLLDLRPDAEAAWPAALARLERLGHGSGRAYAAGIAATTALLAGAFPTM
jgi:Protein of unknown function (DUF2877)